MSGAKFEAACRFVAHELGTGPSDGLNEPFEQLLMHGRKREAALLVVPLDWSVTLRRQGSGRSSAAIFGPSQADGVWAIADNDGLAVLAALAAAVLAGPGGFSPAGEAEDSNCPMTMLSPDSAV
jgi:hypothetical protein